jgi:hypothetical protein
MAASGLGVFPPVGEVRAAFERASAGEGTSPAPQDPPAAAEGSAEEWL